MYLLLELLCISSKLISRTSWSILLAKEPYCNLLFFIFVIILFLGIIKMPFLLQMHEKQEEQKKQAMKRFEDEEK